jgi:hypothetical protein
MGLTERVWQATAVRTFFEGLEEHTHNPTPELWSSLPSPLNAHGAPNV